MTAAIAGASRFATKMDPRETLTRVADDFAKLAHDPDISEDTRRAAVNIVGLLRDMLKED